MNALKNTRILLILRANSFYDNFLKIRVCPVKPDWNIKTGR